MPCTPPSGMMKPVSIDARIHRLLLDGHVRDAAGLVVREFGPAIYGLLQALFRKQPDLADDAFSCFAENLVRGVGSFRGESSVRTWSYCIARNAAVSVARDGWRRLGRRLATREAERLAEEVRTRSALREERKADALAPLRDALDPDEQLLLTLRLDERLPWDDVAEILSSGGDLVTAIAVRRRYTRIKERLGEAARAQGLLG